MSVTITQLRILLDDPDAGSPTFDDTYYQLAIDTEPNIYRAAAMMARIFAAHYSAKTNVKAGPVAIENTQKYEHYKDLADSFDNRAREGGGGSGVIGTGIILTGVSITDINSVNEDEDRYQGVFSRGMHDNPSPNEDATSESCF